MVDTLKKFATEDTENTENTEVYSSVGAALAANNLSDRDEFAAKAAPTTKLKNQNKYYPLRALRSFDELRTCFARA